MRSAAREVAAQLIRQLEAPAPSLQRTNKEADSSAEAVMIPQSKYGHFVRSVIFRL
jgi:hypothetical protein